MQKLLGEEYEAFLAAYELPRAFSLRVNPLKLTREEFLSLAEAEGWQLTPVPWEENGFYYREEDHPGKHPFHEAGFYYIQEASAMAVAALGKARPGEKVLDLCAAPGGKSTQLAAALGGSGLLVANEIHPARARILSQNIERLGITDCVVTNESPEKLAEVFPSFFDRIVVDAPCSGEGMFRKEEDAVRMWSTENVLLCAARQLDILEKAAVMLSPGGTLVYSTCTFAPEENEENLALFLNGHPEFSMENLPLPEGFMSGRPDWCGERTSGVSGQIIAQTAAAFRLFPHRLRGAGHFMAVLKKSGTPTPAVGRTDKSRIDPKALRLWKEFVDSELNGEACKALTEGVPVLFGEELSLLPRQLPLKGLRILRPGLHLGGIRKDRFEPSHALALALKQEQVRIRVNLSPAEAAAYLRGDTLQLPEELAREKGWALVLVCGRSIGWGKASGGKLKNHYPKGLRRS